jgi:hypothetical protein
MQQPKQSQTSGPKVDERQPRIYSPGREFASAKEFADFTREAEVVHLYGNGLLISL